ncbi:hypothetical protein GSI_00041 [Ganoderma sinense ZZ0214-1]|uniref:Uncharacterized protein n=1 Tax=Ganoderma sinense ZZ0214-1 TaxID=1077348 RepID=A0A2G8SRK9_9APHY|nr:hypothetical protein GSI_00041 [Ganoderma sinense ZZ0214-1]
MMHSDSRLITFMLGENIGCPLMLACISECSDVPIACVMMDTGRHNAPIEFCVVCDPNTGMLMVMPMTMTGSGSMMHGCHHMPMGSGMNGMGMEHCGSGNGHGMGMGMRNMMGHSMMGGGMGHGMNSMCNVSMNGMMMGGSGMGGMGGMGCMCGMGGMGGMGGVCGIGGMGGMGMGGMSGMGGMGMGGMGGRMCMTTGRQDMRTSKLVLFKLDPTSACMSDMNNNSDVLCNALRAAQPLWHCRLEHMRVCTSIVVCRNPMTHEIVAVENDSGRGHGMMERSGGVLALMMPIHMRSRL